MSAKEDDNHIYSEMDEVYGESRFNNMTSNNSYGLRSDFAPKVGRRKQENKPKTEDNRCIIVTIILLIICMAVVFMGAVGASVFFALEISEVKSDTASLVRASSDIDASIRLLFSQVNYSDPSAVVLVQNLSNFVDFIYDQANGRFRLMNQTISQLGNMQFQNNLSTCNQETRALSTSDIQYLNVTVNSLLHSFQDLNQRFELLNLLLGNTSHHLESKIQNLSDHFEISHEQGNQRFELLNRDYFLLGNTSHHLKSEIRHLNVTFHTFSQELSLTFVPGDSLIQQLNRSLRTLIDYYSISNQEVSGNFSLTDNALQQLRMNQYLLGNITQQIQNDLKVLIRISSVSSCTALASTSPSGYYFIRTTNGSVVRLYCDMTRSCGGVTGGWTRIAALDMTDSSQECPSALVQTNYLPNLRTCSRPDENGGCTSLSFSASNLPYTRVCGSVIAYQYGVLDAFRGYNNGGRTATLDEAYVSGVSVTRGTPRQHLWTFVAARDELVTHNWSGCECLRPNSFIPLPPPFVGNDYFCDTGSTHHFDTTTFYGNDPLWDGAGCESIRGFINSCCSFNNPPWFHKLLPQPTTDNIELRVCRHVRPTSDLAVEKFEIYVQ